MTLIHFKAMIHLMQVSLVICYCNITFSMFRFPQGSGATLGEMSEVHTIMCRLFLNLTVKTVLMSVDF